MSAKLSTHLVLALGAGLVSLSACTTHPAGLPNGAIRPQVDAPTGVVSALPEGVYEEALEVAVRCEGGDIGSCAHAAYLFQHGAPSEFMKYCGAHGGDHGQEAHGDEHADEAHADEAHAEAAHDEAGHEEAGHDEAGHEEAGHGGGGCPDGHGGQVPVGEPVPHDDELARSLYELSCEGGWLTSCTEAGLMLLHGVGGAADARMGEAYINRACIGGVPTSCMTIASLYRSGELPGGVASAVQAERVACLAGIEEACFATEPVMAAAPANGAPSGHAVPPHAPAHDLAPAADPHAGHDHAEHGEGH
jgi:hypothetical protein